MVETMLKNYGGEDEYRADLAGMLNSGWQVHSETMTEHRGCWRSFLLGLFTTGGLLLSKRRDYHVIYIRGAGPRQHAVEAGEESYVTTHEREAGGTDREHRPTGP